MLNAVFLAGWFTIAFARFHDFDSTLQVKSELKGSPSPAEHAADYWHRLSVTTLQERLAQPRREGPAKNLILFLGDGMSITTITSARIYLGQLSGRSGEEQKLSFEQFPYTGLSKTYCVDSQVADSACSGTAYLSGVKTNKGTIGVTADVKLKDWKAMQNSSWHTPSILQWAQQAGKGTGIVTTCKVTDASPTATYAHTANRDWQTDADIKEKFPEATGIKDITRQLVENMPGSNIKVIMGGGRETFLPNTTDDGYGYKGLRTDQKDLIKMWQESRKAANVNGTYVSNRDQLLNIDVGKTDYLLGLFHHNHMDYHLLANASLQPTLEEMTRTAIKMMQKEANGYFLFIEGGRIDHGHHDNMAHLSLDETVEFHKAIQAAVNVTSEEDTLIVVTSDHGHTLTISGYPTRGSDIFTTLHLTANNLTYPTLSYANGPNVHGFNGDGSQRNISTDNRGTANYTFPTIYKLSSETHDGGDVAVYARGPCAHLLVGNYEQTVIPHVMGYAAGIGPASGLRSAGSMVLAHAFWVLLPLMAWSALKNAL